MPKGAKRETKTPAPSAPSFQVMQSRGQAQHHPHHLLSVSLYGMERLFTSKGAKIGESTQLLSPESFPDSLRKGTRPHAPGIHHTYGELASRGPAVFRIDTD